MIRNFETKELAIRRSLSSSPRDANPGLSSKQVKMLQALADGLSMKDIAMARGMSIHTVHTHLREAYRRLGANVSNQAIAKAVRAGWI